MEASLTPPPRGQKCHFLTPQHPHPKVNEEEEVGKEWRVNKGSVGEKGEDRGGGRGTGRLRNEEVGQGSSKRKPDGWRLSSPKPQAPSLDSRLLTGNLLRLIIKYQFTRTKVVNNEASHLFCWIKKEVHPYMDDKDDNHASRIHLHVAPLLNREHQVTNFH